MPFFSKRSYLLGLLWSLWLGLPAGLSAQDPADPGEDMGICRFYFPSEFFSSTAPELLPYLPPPQNKALGIKRLIFRLETGLPEPSRTQRTFVMSKKESDTAHVMEFDKAGNLVRLTSNNLWLNSGNRIRGEVALGIRQVDTWQYDQQGRLIEERSIVYRLGGSVDDHHFGWSYPEIGRKEKRIISNTPKNAQSIDYVTVYHQNDEGKVYLGQEIVIESGGESIISEWEYHYNDLGKLTRIVNSEEHLLGGMFGPGERFYVYDEKGQLSFSAPLSQYSDSLDASKGYYRYDERGYPIQALDGGNPYYIWTWSSEGVPVSHSFPAANNAGTFITYRIEAEYYE